MTPAEALAEVRRIEITTRRLVRDLVAGEYASAFRGRGVEFAEVREYQPGDDIRTIDWNVTARLGAAFVKRFLEERELSVLFMVDLSRSTGFGSTMVTKAELSAELCAVLALAAARNHDRAGLVGFTERIEICLPPRKGRRYALRIVNDLLSTAPAGARTDLTAGLEVAATLLRRASVIFVISDFLATGYEHALERLGRRHDVVLVQIVDPRERELPKAGLLRVRDPEGSAWRIIDCGDRRVRAAYHAAGQEFDRNLRQRAEQFRCDLLRLECGQDYAVPLLEFLRRRERRLRR